MVVVEEVGPEQRTAGQPAGAAGARKLLAERPPGGCRQLRLGPPRGGRNAFGHAVYDDEFSGRRGGRRDGVGQNADDVSCDAQWQQRQVKQHGS